MLLLPPPGAIAAGTGTLVLKTDSGPHYFNIEIATTNGERALGLMYRRELPADAGMLFLYDPPQPITMWMRNTILPLDMIFIDDDREIVGIVEKAVPFSTANRSVAGASRYVLEVNGGFAAEHGVKAGQTVDLPMLTVSR